ncbi:MAG TPA: BON domain-containing protein [Aquabacterium sp.]|uniref:BON domain-containing protein n=1 Tax=Aquabacterium sp. TaxID=1872578 RepID=UPI002E3027B2|nr:BON domain-containing protein [Aquabacterium sp.]HEX5374341.1 BON domain-containing protein [Aquabacterium sp.]
MTAVLALLVMPGCAVTRGQSTVGEYIDDAGITTQIKAKLVESKLVDAAAVKVETLNGEVILSGFAKNEEERAIAGRLASETKGVRSVKNALLVRQ